MFLLQEWPVGTMATLTAATTSKNAASARRAPLRLLASFLLAAPYSKDTRALRMEEVQRVEIRALLLNSLTEGPRLNRLYVKHRFIGLCLISFRR